MAEEGRNRVTSVEVAKLAGVSQSAVSRTFTKGASVSQKTKEKVLEAASMLGYRPNLVARSLLTGRTNVVGLAVGSLANPFYAAVVEKLSNALQANGHHVLLFTLSESGDSEELLHQVINLRLYALVMASVSLSSTLAKSCRDHGIPVVLVNRTTDAEGCFTVATDNEAGATEVGEFLLAAGHSRILYVAGREKTSTNLERERGLLKTIASRTSVSFKRISGAYDFRTSESEVERFLLAAEYDPDAIVCANDYMAFAVMDTIRYKLGLRVPEDISIVGFDDSAPAAWLSYDLTTYAQDVDGMVEQVASILQGVSNQATTEGGDFVVPGKLIVRSSCRAPDAIART